MPADLDPQRYKGDLWETMKRTEARREPLWEAAEQRAAEHTPAAIKRIVNNPPDSKRALAEEITVLAFAAGWMDGAIEDQQSEAHRGLREEMRAIVKQDPTTVPAIMDVDVAAERAKAINEDKEPPPVAA